LPPLGSGLSFSASGLLRVEDKHFDRPAQIVTGPHGSVVLRIDTAMQAADYLLNKWPTPGGAKHLAARKVCVAVLEGLKKSQVARKAFEAAAYEADPRRRPS
jgi:hypothetical protein